MEKVSNNDFLRQEYKMIAGFMGYTYFERTKLGSLQNREYPGWFNTKDIDLTHIKNSTSVLSYKVSNRFIAGKTLDLNFRYDYEKLMSVVDFIEKIESQRFGGFDVVIKGDQCDILPKRKSKEVVVSVTHISKGNKKSAIYGACLRFIEKYKNLNNNNETN